MPGSGGEGAGRAGVVGGHYSEYSFASAVARVLAGKSKGSISLQMKASVRNTVFQIYP